MLHGQIETKKRFTNKKGRYMKNKTLPLFFAVALLFLNLTATGCGNKTDNKNIKSKQQETVFSPYKVGPYPVGAKTIVLVDSSRQDKIIGGPRTLVTEVWYPAVDSAKDTPYSTLKDYFGKDFEKAMNKLMEEFGGDFQVNISDAKLLSHRNVKIRDGKFPVVIFSHGNGGVRFQSVYMTEFLASHGYVVVAPDHTGNAAVTVINGKVITFNINSFAYGMIDRVFDIKFILDQLAIFNEKGSGSFLSSHLDLNNIGMSGHSFGAYTSISVASRDNRIKAILPQAAPGYISENLKAPAMYMLSDKDQTIKETGNAGIKMEFNMTDSPAFLVEFKNGGHFTFSNMCDIIPDFGDGCGTEMIDGHEVKFIDYKEAYKDIDYYAVSFFGYYLKHQKEYAKYILTNPDKKEIRFESNVIKLQ